MRYPERLRQARARARLTQAELAVKLGLHQYTISRCESGKFPRKYSALAIIQFVEDAEKLDDGDIEQITRALTESLELRNLVRKILTEKFA